MLIIKFSENKEDIFIDIQKTNKLINRLLFSSLYFLSITIIDKAYIADKLIIISGIAGPKIINKGIKIIKDDNDFSMLFLIILTY